MKERNSKSRKFMKYIMGHPNANVKELSAKLGIAASLGYKLRKQAQQQREEVIDRLAGKPLPVPAVTDVNTTLNTRAVNYGTFKDGAALMQAIKRSMAQHAAKHDKTFADDQWEALEMIVHKIGRIVNGNPDVVDHWVDIAGYATLIADRLEGRAR